MRNGDGQTSAHPGIRNPGKTVETLGEVMIRRMARLTHAKAIPDGVPSRLRLGECFRSDNNSCDFMRAPPPALTPSQTHQNRGRGAAVDFQ